MTPNITFSTSGPSFQDRASVFFRGPYENICTHFGRVAAEFKHIELEEMAKYARNDGYFDITRLDNFGLCLIKRAASELLMNPSLIDWEEKIESASLFDQECQHQGKTRNEMLCLIREATVQQLQHLVEKINPMI